MLNPHYNDVYAAGGLPEKAYVFVQGNNLPQRFQTAKAFTVAELGFGLGLALLAAWQAWRQAAPAGSALTYISFEKHPLPTAALVQAHQAFPQAAPFSQSLLNTYAPRPGWNHEVLPGLNLHLYVGEAAVGLVTPSPALGPDWQADAWFLDGHAPAKNPALWTPQLLMQVAARTKPGGTASTYSVAAAVRQGLHGAGFTVEKTSGFPPKRHMLRACKPGR